MARRYFARIGTLTCHLELTRSCEGHGRLQLLWQVIAGLKKHIAKQSLQGSLVVLILNLKPAKLAGHASEAMVLAGVAPLPDGGELVHPICPPGVSRLLPYLS